MTTPNGVDPLDRLRAADPIHADDLPAASLARVTATIQEHIMTDKTYDPTVPHPRRPLRLVGGLALAGALALAIAVGTGLGLDPGTSGPIGAVPSPSDNPAAGGGVASCLVYDPANLPMHDIVFDGTVTAVDGDQVTFDVNTGWKGVDDAITLTAPQVDIAISGPLPDFKVGGRYLVTAYGSTINACGYTLDHDADTAASWAAAFGS